MECNNTTVPFRRTTGADLPFWASENAMVSIMLADLGVRVRYEENIESESDAH